MQGLFYYLKPIIVENNWKPVSALFLTGITFEMHPFELYPIGEKFTFIEFTGTTGLRNEPEQPIRQLYLFRYEKQSGQSPTDFHIIKAFLN